MAVKTGGVTTSSETYGVFPDLSQGSRLSESAPSGSGDATPPVVSNVTPASGGALAATRALARVQPVSFDVTDVNPGIALLLITMKYAGSSETYVVYNGTGFVGSFDSAQSTVTAIASGFTFTVLPIGGWLGDIEALRVHAVDAAGEVTPA